MSSKNVKVPGTGIVLEVYSKSFRVKNGKQIVFPPNINDHTAINLVLDIYQEIEEQVRHEVKKKVMEEINKKLIGVLWEQD